MRTRFPWRDAVSLEARDSRAPATTVITTGTTNIIVRGKPAKWPSGRRRIGIIAAQPRTAAAPARRVPGETERKASRALRSTATVSRIRIAKSHWTPKLEKYRSYFGQNHL